jgi:soluble lytic murein transglycosylase-like protein
MKHLRAIFIHSSFKIWFTFSIVAVTLAIYPAYLEHKVRLSKLVPELVPVVEPISVEEKETSLYRQYLNPSPEILAKVRLQANQKPSFDKKASVYEALIQEVAKKHEISPALVKAVIQAESKFDSNAISSQGAVGLMQILPSTGRSMGILTLNEPGDNVLAGVLYLKTLLKEFDDDEYLAIAAYNCGPDAVRRYGNQMPPFTETKVFVSRVMAYYQSYINS